MGDSPWENRPEELALNNGEVHIWRVWLDQSASFFYQVVRFLSEDDRARARRFRFGKDRARWIIGRGLLRVILGHYLRVEPAQLQFSYSPFGKPALSFPVNAGLHFNMSHSDDMALCALSADSPVGVDIERMRMIPMAEEIVARYFSAQEADAWRSLSPRLRPVAFLRSWVRKEACLKASGRGLAGLSDKIAVAPVPETGNAAPAALDESDGTTDCILHDLAPASGFVGALALCRRWTRGTRRASREQRYPNLSFTVRDSRAA
jgi:4'-phosphopantetheinyl transferase